MRKTSLTHIQIPNPNIFISLSQNPYNNNFFYYFFDLIQLYTYLNKLIHKHEITEFSPKQNPNPKYHHIDHHIQIIVRHV